jgi:hypothetical protein
LGLSFCSKNFSSFIFTKEIFAQKITVSQNTKGLDVKANAISGEQKRRHQAFTFFVCKITTFSQLPFSLRKCTFIKC